MIVSCLRRSDDQGDSTKKQKVEEISDRVDLGRIEGSRLCSLPTTGRKKRAPVNLYLIHRYLHKVVMRNLLPLFQDIGTRDQRLHFCSSVLHEVRAC